MALTAILYPVFSPDHWEGGRLELRTPILESVPPVGRSAVTWDLVFAPFRGHSTPSFMNQL